MSQALEYEHAIAEEVEPVLRTDDLAVGFECELPSDEGGHQKQVARARLVQVSQHRVNHLVAVAGVDIEVSPPFTGAHASARLSLCGDGFERAHDARPDRHDAPASPPSAVDCSRRRLLHPVPLRADSV